MKKKERVLDQFVVLMWKNEVVSRAEQFEESRWEDLWYGLVLGLGRPDLADYSKYMEMGFPCEALDE